MTGIEICLIVIGAIVIAISFIFSEHFGGSNAETEILKDGKFSQTAEEIIRKEVQAELSLIIDEKLEEAKKELTRISSEKILAMGEYSDDINLRINKNHEEVMFLYNMLNDKEIVVKNTIKDIEALKVSVKKMALVNDLSTGEIVKENSKQGMPKLEEATEEMVSEKEAHKEQPKEAKSTKINLKTSNNNKKIIDLYNKGFSNIEIAKKLGLGVGEVRLVNDLFNSKK